MSAFYAETLVQLIADYYAIPGNIAGGNLHIATDDGNLDTDSLLFCEQLCFKEGDLKGLEILLQLGEITEEHREALYSTQWKESITIEEFKKRQQDKREQEEDEYDEDLDEA